MSAALARIFLFPGEFVCDALHATAEDDRTMIRMLVNMLVWNLLGVLVVIAIW